MIAISTRVVLGLLLSLALLHEAAAVPDLHLAGAPAERVLGALAGMDDLAALQSGMGGPEGQAAAGAAGTSTQSVHAPGHDLLVNSVSPIFTRPCGWGCSSRATGCS